MVQEVKVWIVLNNFIEFVNKNVKVMEIAKIIKLWII